MRTARIFKEAVAEARLPVTRVGLDFEALPSPDGVWYGPAKFRMAVCFAFQSGKAKMQYRECVDRRPGLWTAEDLLELRSAVTAPGAVVVAHNADYDLNLLNGLLLDHPDLGGAFALPDVQVQDTMGPFRGKWGGAARNTLSARCARANALGARVETKAGSPDWRRVAQGFADAWAEMKDYVMTDVACTLGLEEFYRTWPNETTIPIRTKKGAA